MKNKKEKKNRGKKRISQTRTIIKKQNKKRIITKENKHEIMLNAFEDFKNENFTITELAKKYEISQSTMSKYISIKMSENKYGTYNKNYNSDSGNICGSDVSEINN